MGLRFLRVALCGCGCLFTSQPKLHTLYLMQQNQIEEALQSYRDSLHLSGQQDFEVLREMSLLLLQKGAQDEDPQVFLMTLFGAGLSGSSAALEILQKGIDHIDPHVQLLALHFISQIADDKTFELFNHAMSSPYLSTRMEAAFAMAARKHPLACGQIEGLMFRLPPVFKPYFPCLFALLGTLDATSALKRLVDDLDPQVRVESILNIARLSRDDFLPLLRKRLSHAHVAELEATLFCMGTFKDSASFSKVKKLSKGPTELIRLAANLALLQLGDRSSIGAIQELAQKENLFAIASLGQIPDTEEVLAPLLSSQDLQVKLNASIALLQLRDPRCVEILAEFLIEDSRVLGFHPHASIGHSLLAWKAVPAADLQGEDSRVDVSMTLAIREHFLREALHLPEPFFLKLAKMIFLAGQNDLIPTLVYLLENLRTHGSIQLLKQMASHPKTSLIRDYCHLALFRLGEEGPYEEYLMKWIMSQKGQNLIQLHPLLPWKFRMEQSDYTLTAEETSRLLIESFLAIANKRDEQSISFLLEAIQLGNPVNRYALMGLLMRATE